MISGLHISLPIVIVFGLLGILTVAWLLLKSRALLPKRILQALVLLRGTMLVMMLLILINPSCIKEVADPSAYTVALLGEASLSMLIEDVENQSRLNFVAQQMDLDSAQGLLNKISGQHPYQAFTFAEKLISAEDPVRLMPGRPTIGDNLENLRNRRAPRGGQWGAVVLMSDGIQTSGPSPIAAARRYGEAGIPIHVIGVGDAGTSGDISVHFTQSELQGTRGESMAVEIILTNRFDRAYPVSVQLSEEDEVLETREIQLEAGAMQSEIFQVEPRRGGLSSYRVNINGPSPRRNPATDADYAMARIEEPRQYRMLFLGRPQWDYRFLHILFEQEERYLLKAWLQTGPSRFITRGFDENERDTRPDSFPETGELFQNFDIIYLDMGIFDQLNPDVQNTLAEFVSSGGGGLIISNEIQNTTDRFAALIPGRDTTVLAFRDDHRLTPVAGALLRDEDQSLFTRSPGIFLGGRNPARSPLSLPRGARAALKTAEGQPLLTYHAYGAGRVAYHGLQDSWRWRLESASGTEQHRRYWLSIIEWLAESRRSRLEAPLQGQVLDINESAPLEIRLLDNAFRPRSDARVRATVTSPRGDTSEHTLFPKFGEPGVFENQLDLIYPGEYRVDFRAELPGGETLQRGIHFAASSENIEGDTGLNESLLRDIARLSGGDYFHWSEIQQIRHLPISSQVPSIRSTLYWARSLSYILLLLIIAALEWGIRRRYGLR